MIYNVKVVRVSQIPRSVMPYFIIVLDGDREGISYYAASPIILEEGQYYRVTFEMTPEGSVTVTPV